MAKLPVISLWMPWANWVVLGWKTVETRTHRRFANLAGNRIAIHAAQKWDNDALALARPYLTPEEYELSQKFLRIGGAIIGTADVVAERWLGPNDSDDALIDCRDTLRHGLFLRNAQPVEAIPMRGKQGIWYAEIPERN